MSDIFDVIIVGSGPAGVSTAFPLVQAGLKVLMVDGGREADLAPPSRSYLYERYENEEQWKWMVGENFNALREFDAVSPKLRAPTHNYVFDGFVENANLEARNFIAVGSLAKGGLSNSWGCGVARLSPRELADYPFSDRDIVGSYEEVSRRIGISGAEDDDLANYFGIDSWVQPPIEMDLMHKRMFSRYESNKTYLRKLDFRMGRSRVAVLSQSGSRRQACDLSSNCLWGCHRKALYSSADEIASLQHYNNFYYRSGFIVNHIIKNNNGIAVSGQDTKESTTLTAKKIILAAGTLATTRLALKALNIDSPVRLQSSPTAAFLLWLPKFLGQQNMNGFGLGQLSYSLKLSDEISAFGSTFSTTGLPVSEFVRHVPFSKRFGIDVLSQLLSSCLVGNVFLPGNLSTSDILLKSDGKLKITGGYHSSVPSLMSDISRRLSKSYRKLGAFLLPKSFVQGIPGADIHYSSTLPMSRNPLLGQTGVDGELAGMMGVHVADGACLTNLTEKSHTLTIMANADRIGKILATKLTEKL